MANPIVILKMSGIEKKEKRDDKAISELINRAFTTRNLLHFQHWRTTSYAAHMALGDLYDDIIEDIDEITECYQGKNGIIEGLACGAASVPEDICGHVKTEMDWVEANRKKISKGNSSIENLLDSLIGHYQKCVYKLENLR